MKNTIWKKLFFVFLFLAVIAGIIIPAIPQISSKTRVYYSGDAIAYNGKLIFGSTNMDSLEIFTLENNKIVRQAKLDSFRSVYGGDNDYRDLLFNIENGHLYAYAVDGRYLYKFDLQDLSRPRQIAQIRDNAWDWFRGLARANGKLLTIGSKGVKVWNNDLTVVDSFKITSYNPKNISFSSNLKYIFAQEDNKLKVFSTETRSIVTVLDIVNNFGQPRNAINYADNRIMVVDDKALRTFDFSGRQLDSFKHTSDKGYYVVLSANSSYLYFSDGLGVVKSRTSDLEPVDWIYASQIQPKGAWAMDIKVASDSKGEKVVVFDNNNIAVLDSNLDLIDYFMATEETTSPIEKLGLSIDKNHAASGSQVLLSGQGFGIGEDLVVTFADTKINMVADQNGRFSRIITIPTPKTVPLIKPTRTDIKVEGQASKLSYSIGFEIE